MLIPIILFALVSCGKEFLDIRREANQVVPTTISDFQALLDLNWVMNEKPSVGLGIIGADEYRISDDRFFALSSAYQRNAYIWAEEIFEGGQSEDWNLAYQRILYANMALDVEKIIPRQEQQEAWNNVKGSALFFRALNHYHLAQLFCRPFDATTSSQDPGIPIRLDYDMTERSHRRTVSDVYEQIVRDLLDAIDLLPNNAPTKFRPGKAAVCALLSRVFLQKQDFESAHYYADLGLQLQGELVDFNDLDLDARYTFPSDYGDSNPEVYFFSSFLEPIASTSRFDADSILLESYALHDLRYRAYFHENPDGRMLFKGSYQGGTRYFTGFASDELWLVRAECRTRLGDIHGALSDLNHLAKHRYVRGEFTPFSISDPSELLQIILDERKKELFMRGVRWEDLRRLNKEARFTTTLKRKIAGQEYDLEPNDPRWVWPIPDNEIELSNFSQNDR